MIVRDPAQGVSDGQWTSVRLLLEGDGMGFSVRIATLEAGSERTFEKRTTSKASIASRARARSPTLPPE